MYTIGKRGLRIRAFAASYIMTACTLLASGAGVPAFSLPLSRQHEHQYSEPVILLMPVVASTPATTWKYYYVYTQTGVMAFEAATDSPAWTQPAPCRRQPTLLYACTDRVLLATPYQVFACDTTTGDRLWEHGAYPADLDSPNADHERYPRFHYHSLDGNRLVSFRNNGRAMCVNITNGTLQWYRQLEYPPIGPAVFRHGIIAYPATRRGRTVCYVLNAKTGELRQVLDRDGNMAIERIFISPNGCIITLTVRSLSAYDVATGRILWHVENDRPIIVSSTQMGADGIYLSIDGYRILKVSLTSGRLIWKSQAVPLQHSDTVSVTLHKDYLFVTGEDVALVLNAANGRTVAAPTIPPSQRLGPCFVTERYLVALAIQEKDGGKRITLHAYDYQSGTMAPADHREVRLGEFGNIDAAIVRNNALVIQDGQRIRAWSSSR